MEGAAKSRSSRRSVVVVLVNLLTAAVFWVAAVVLTSRIASLGSAQGQLAGAWHSGDINSWLPLAIAAAAGVAYGQLQARSLRAYDGWEPLSLGTGVHGVALVAGIAYSFHLSTPAMALYQGLGTYAQGVGLLVFYGVAAVLAAVWVGGECIWGLWNSATGRSAGAQITR